MQNRSRFRQIGLTALALSVAALATAGGGALAQTPAEVPSGLGPPPGVSGPPPGGQGGLETPMVFPPDSVLGVAPLSPNAPKPNDKPRDFEGVYVGRPLGDPLGRPNATYTPKGEARAVRRRAIAAHDMGIILPVQKCRPYDAIFNPSQPIYPVTIVQNDKRIVVLEEEGRTIWEIYLDRGQPADIAPSYNGNSVGHWEGDTLVVDTVGYNGLSWLDVQAGPNSAQTHVVTRIKKNVLNGDIEFAIQVDDPDIYAKTRHERYALVWNSEIKMHEFDCESGLGIGTFPGLVEDSDEHPYIVHPNPPQPQ